MTCAKADAGDSDSSFSVLQERLSWPSRTNGAGTLRSSDVGTTVTLCGWVDKQRDMGGLVFADIRDHTGLFQIVSDDDTPAEAGKLLSACRAEWVVAVTGTVRERKDKNSKILTGDVELLAESVDILNTVGKSLPFSISGDDDDSEKTSEEVRLKNRVLDLRRPKMTNNLKLRSKTIKALRDVLENKYDFMEVETPILTRSTPEGARDYLVPSRLQPGNCYALPQSPQVRTPRHKILLAFSCVFATSVSDFSTQHVRDSSPSRYEQRMQYVPIHPPDCCPYKRLTCISKIHSCSSRC